MSFLLYLSHWILLATSLLAQSLPVLNNDLTAYDQSLFIPYTSPFSSANALSIDGKINGNVFTFPIDTASTGVMIGAPLLQDSMSSNSEQTHYLLGWKFKASTSLLYTGRLVPMNISFQGAARDEAVSQLSILVVDQVVKCSYYNTTTDLGSCAPSATTPSPIPLDRIMNMGVGFGLPTSSMQLSTPTHNPFLSLLSLNDQPLSTFRMGYTLTTTGVTLGLTTSNTAGAAWIALSRSASSDPRDWAMVPVSFSINNRTTFAGRAVIDTSTSAMTIQSSALLAGAQPLTPGYARRVSIGTHLTFAFPDFENGVAGYDFAVGDGEFPSQPAYVEPVVGEDGDVFISMGRSMWSGFTTVFDADGGRFGFICEECV